jgi:3-hydroxyacyl-CoA dehydrogenase/enoyl-CoA hydratase/3-hydroxybutyryl-CoA epimerase
MTDFTYATDADGVAVISWDQQGTSLNVMNEAAFAELEGLFDRAMADDSVRGVIITSAKKDFAGGMDLNVIARMRAGAGDNPAQGIMDGLMNIHRILRKIERNRMDPKTLKGAKPVAWASPGTSAGIGTEIALACHRRIVADNPKARIGLPEILVGIFPGSGGTTRMVRMVGAMAAAPALLEGKMMAPAQAKAAGMIDEVVAPDQLLARAKDWVLAARDEDTVKPWDRKDYRMPGGAPYHPAGFPTYVGASAMVHGKTQGVYPAARAMLSAIYEGALVPFDTALRIEARWFTSVILNPSSSAMIRSLFLNKQALEKGAVRPKGVADQSVKRLGVLGAGMMGAGIAYVAAMAGIGTVLIDRDQAAADRGRDAIAGLLADAVKKRRMDQAKADATLALVTATPDYAALKGADLVVEAVFEDPAVKAEATQRTEAALGGSGIFATNTSTLPITELARAFTRTADFVGIHFFSPVHKMNLVEIIRGRGTGDAAVAKALDFVRQIRKTPIVVNDARFFYANRCIIPYINEGTRMVGEGIAPALVEHAALMLGFPVGPLQLVDETSIDLGVRIARATKAALGAAYDDGNDTVIFALADKGRLGRKVNAGFYEYDDKGRRGDLWPGLADLWAPAASQPDLTEVQHRLAMVQVLEAVRALEEGVLTDIREGDVGAILGWGFMPWSGGPFSWLDILGAARAVDICDGLAARHGARFAAPALLREMATRGETFYGRFDPAAAA